MITFIKKIKTFPEILGKERRDFGTERSVSLNFLVVHVAQIGTEFEARVFRKPGSFVFL